MSKLAEQCAALHQFNRDLDLLVKSAQGGSLSDASIGRTLKTLGIALILSDESWDELVTEFEIDLSTARLGRSGPVYEH